MFPFYLFLLILTGAGASLLAGLGAGLSDFGRSLAKDFAKALEKRALVRA
jgi:hypothetical protein